jgi:cytosine/adenosine deaminase-related metal-dependent hydrolase
VKALTASFILPISRPPIQDGAVVVDDSKIVAVGRKEEILSKHTQYEVEDFGSALLMPGLVNAHTHLDLLFFESPQNADFLSRLLGGWNYRKQLTPSNRRSSLEEGIRQLLRSGTTCVGDTGRYVGVAPQAANSPIRMVLFPELLTGGDASIQEEYEAAFAQVEEILGTGSARLSAGIAPYAAYTLSRHLLKIMTQQAKELRIPMKIHAAETFSEMQFFYESAGEIAEKLFPELGWTEALPPPHRKTPVQYLASIGFLEGAPTLIGCNHLSDPDLETLSRTGTKVVHSPRANAHLKLGHPPIKKILAAGIPLALGTDGTASLHSLSLWDEMRYIQNHYKENDIPSPTELLTIATLGGARALGMDDRIGSLDAGKEADLLAIRIPRNEPAENLPDWIVSHVTDREIAAVFVEGKRVKM